MSRNILSVLIVLLMMVTTAFAQTTYYVSSSGGDDNNDGRSPSSAWKTINKVNYHAFDDGDTICFKRGDTFSDKSLLIYNIPNNFTIRDFGTGSLPWFNGNVIWPIKIRPSTRINNLSIINIDISGQGWYATKSTNLSIRNVNSLLIDGVIGDGHRGWDGSTLGKNAIAAGEDCSGLIEIKNCHLENWGLLDLITIGSDYGGIHIYQITEPDTEILIHDNVIHNVTSDAILLTLNTAPTLIYGNLLYNCGEDCMDVKGTDNCEIYDNTCYREPDFTGEGGSGSGGFPTLICIHEGPGDVHSRNHIVRDNRFLGGDVAAVKTANVSNIKIYRNEFKNLGLNGLRIQGDSEDIQFFNNLVLNSSIWQNNNYTGVLITNNTLYNSSILIDWCEGTGIHNNISYSDELDIYLLDIFQFGQAPEISHNLWSNAASDRRIIYLGTEYNVSEYNNWLATHPGELFCDPLFVDSTTENYHLLHNSPGINSGNNSEVSVDTDLDGNPRIVGGIVDMGAYELQNQPPVAICQVAVVAVGEVPNIDDGSYDPDGDTITLSQSPSGAFDEAGIYDVTLTVTDSAGAMDSCITMVVVYDPSAGFVTGGGWVDSPEGAFTFAPLLSGKANFGFVSKYKKGAEVPTGNTEFQFHAGGLDFHSSSYEWLVVTGSDYARFKGVGFIEEVPGEFKFMLWAGDGNPDTFRIKIWAEDEFGNEDIVYDNEMNQPISGGSIKIHTK